MKLPGSYIALVIALFFGFSAFFSIHQLYKENSKKNDFEIQIGAKEKRMMILYDDICTGFYDILIARDQNARSFNLRGMINVSLAKKERIVQVFAEIYFNSLRQLNSGVIRLNLVDAASISIELEQVKPILAHLSVTRDQQELIDHIFTFPGPLNIIEIEEGKFGFDYPFNPLAGLQLLNMKTSPLTQRITQINISDKRKEHCPDDTFVPVELDQIYEAIESQIFLLDNFTKIMDE